MEKILIYYNSVYISLMSNDKEPIEAIKKEFVDYYIFINNKEINNYANRLILLKNDVLYNRYADRKFKKNNDNDSILIMERNVLILYNKTNNTITIVYSAITEDIMQLVGEIILSLFGKELEKREFYFFHAACVAFNNCGIAIMGEKNTGKSSLMCEFLKNNFLFIANSRIGVKRQQITEVIGLPSRIGIRYDTINKVFNEEEKERFIIKRGEEYRRKRKKINISIQEIKYIFETEAISNAKLKLVIVPVYIPEKKTLEIKKMDKREIIDTLLSIRKPGVYDPVKYVDTFYKTDRPKFDINIFNNVKFVKAVVNETNSYKLVNWVKNGLKNEK